MNSFPNDKLFHTCNLVYLKFRRNNIYSVFSFLTQPVVLLGEIKDIMDLHYIATIKILIFIISPSIADNIAFPTDSKETHRKYMSLPASVEMKQNLQEVVPVNIPHLKHYLLKLNLKPNHDLMENERKGIFLYSYTCDVYVNLNKICKS